MSAETKLSEEEAAWVRVYGKGVCGAFESIFSGAKDQFKDGHRLLERFKAAVEEVLKIGCERFHSVDEAHNELCIGAAILQNSNPMFTVLEYEPQLPGCSKSIDFRARTADGVTLFVDVKTIKPIPKDRWEQFEKALAQGWFPDHVTLMFSKEWLGGELWHYRFAVRSRILGYTLEFEQKIAECKLLADNTFFVLMLCGEGFYWREDELEDFVSFYFTGAHRSDDPFAKVETKYIGEKKLKLARTISRFACMRRPQGEVHKKRLNWNVQAPRDPTYQ